MKLPGRKATVYVPRYCTGSYIDDGTRWACYDCGSIVLGRNSSISRHDHRHDPTSTYRQRQTPGAPVVCGKDGTCTKEFVNFNSYYAHWRRDHGRRGGEKLLYIRFNFRQSMAKLRLEIEAKAQEKAGKAGE